jgi:MFS transporter, OFA family, oxalate/formate antiporter
VAWAFSLAICFLGLAAAWGGTMPLLILDTFGPRHMAAAYGLVLTAWSAGGIVGPQIVAAFKDRCPESAAAYSFFTSAAFLAVGLGLSLMLRGQQTDESP